MAGEDMPAGPTDPIFNRLLKDRIIWMGEEVKDDMANRICAQMLMLAAEDPKKDIWPVSYTHLTLPTIYSV